MWNFVHNKWVAASFISFNKRCHVFKYEETIINFFDIVVLRLGIERRRYELKYNSFISNYALDIRVQK